LLSALLYKKVAKASLEVFPGVVYASQPVALCHLPSEAAALT